jgi:predicted ester cyclase
MAYDTDKMASWLAFNLGHRYKSIFLIPINGKTADKRSLFKIDETIYKIINKGER